MNLVPYFVRTGGRGSAVVAVIFLCVCVLFQMLGVPVTLLNPSASSDTLGTSVLEGFSVLPTLHDFVRSSQYLSLSNVYPSLHAPLLSSMLFHPPVSNLP